MQIVTSITASSTPDRVEAIGFPDPSVSARPLAASENTPVSNLGLLTAILFNDIEFNS
jgi:hypothetical protein